MSGEALGDVVRVANTLRRVRFEKRITQKELHEKSGVSQRTIRHLEKHDEVVPTDGTLFPLADALEVDPAWLLAEFKSAA